MTTITLAGATGWVGRALVGAISAAPDLRLVAAVSRSAAGGTWVRRPAGRPWA